MVRVGAGGADQLVTRISVPEDLLHVEPVRLLWQVAAALRPPAVGSSARPN